MKYIYENFGKNKDKEIAFLFFLKSISLLFLSLIIIIKNYLMAMHDMKFITIVNLSTLYFFFLVFIFSVHFIHSKLSL